MTTVPVRLTPAFLFALAACAPVGPDPLAPPRIDLPAAYVGADAAAPVSRAETRFWTAYRDPMLNDIIGRGLAQSLDILAAQERIRAAQADLRGQGIAATHLSGNASASLTRSGAGSVSGESHSAGLGAALVFDLFGGLFRQRQASAAALDASAAAAQATRLAWLAEVIGAYSNARYYQQALEVTRQSIRTRDGTVRITADKVEIGTATNLELIQARAQLESARADLPAHDAQFAAQVFRLATLLNEPAGPLLVRMQRGAPLLRIPPTPSAGIPADLLRIRPDVRQAEMALVQATAAIGVATADMLPSLTLSGSITDTGSSGWSFGPQLSLPVLNQTGLSATRDRRVAEAAQAGIEWRAAVASAIEDVQTALSNLRRTRQRLSALSAALRSQEEAHDLAVSSFRENSITLLELLEIDRTTVSARSAVLSAENDAAQQWAVLSLAIGEGLE